MIINPTPCTQVVGAAINGGQKEVLHQRRPDTELIMMRVSRISSYPQHQSQSLAYFITSTTPGAKSYGYCDQAYYKTK